LREKKRERRLEVMYDKSKKVEEIHLGGSKSIC
jgi:hypothetical protein